MWAHEGGSSRGWRKLHNVNLLSSSYTPNMARVIGEEGMKWADIMHEDNVKE
jgi:hypothetical protein